MNANEYQKMAARTMSVTEPLASGIHGALGLCAEIAEVYEACQQATETDDNAEHIEKELGDCWWMLAEICTSQSIPLEEVLTDGTAKEASFIYASKIAGIFQKTYQGHEVNREELKKLLVEVALTLMHFSNKSHLASVEKVWEKNIEKLKKRYPKGFESERSIHRDENDD